MALITANQITSLWGLFHPDYVAERWNVFVVYMIMVWSCASVVMFCNRALPILNHW